VSDTTPSIASRTAQAGLCASCRHVQVVTSSRESIFYRCLMADVDPAFRRYPVLPVLTCRGYERDTSS
jgi:hypothetical protein